VGSYLFDASTNPFFSSLAVSGSDATSSYTFLRALLVFPQESTTSGSPPPFAESSTGFVTSDLGKPIIVRLSTQVRRSLHCSAVGVVECGMSLELECSVDGSPHGG
jgi:hypothetical protein